MPEAAAHAVAIVGAGIGGAHMDGYLALAGRAPGARVETDLQAVLDDPAVGIVDICMPPSLHAEVALRALAAGKHVVCEKPLAASLEVVDRMIAAADAAGRQVVPVFQYRFGHRIRRLRHLVDAGLAGRAYTATLETHWDRDAAYYGVAWRGTWDGELGGAVVSHAIHTHDLLCSVLGAGGAGRRLSGDAGQHRGNRGLRGDHAGNGERRAGDLVDHPGCGGKHLAAAVLFCQPDRRKRTGTLSSGRRRLALHGPRAVGPAGPGRRVGDRPPPAPERFAGFFAALDRRLRGAEGDGVSPADGRRSIELATAVYAAARTGRTIALPLAKDVPHYRGWRP